MTKWQMWVGGMLIISGINYFLASQIGWVAVGPLYTLGAGILMLLAPWSDEPTRQRQIRMGGVWTTLAGAATFLAFMGLHQFHTPLFMIGAGVIYLTGLYRKEA